MTDWHSSGSCQPLRMGNAFSSSVDFKVGEKILIKNHARHRRRSVSAPTLPTTDTTWSTISLRFKRRKVRLHEERLEYYDGEDIKDIESQLAKFPFDDNSSRVKFHKFVTAWRGALSYPHAKMQASSTGIPVAATSTCKNEISRWQRYTRSCLQCSSEDHAEQILADLLHKQSLRRFVKNTEAIMVGTSSIVIKEGHNEVWTFQSVGNSESEQNRSLQMTEDEDEDNNLTLTVQFNFPPRVQLEHPLQAAHHVAPNEELVKHSWELKHITRSEFEQSRDRNLESLRVRSRNKRRLSTSSLRSTG